MKLKTEILTICFFAFFLLLNTNLYGEDKSFTNSIGMKFVLIPSGSFMMGCNMKLQECSNDEIPHHKVTISKPFYMGTYEVTQEQWVRIMGINPGNINARNNPVEQVSWYDVQEFIEKLNAKEGKQYRLPTEAEWEYAARAGTATKYFFGHDTNTLGQYAWYNGNSQNTTHPVGTLKPNQWGLYDMYGNVWEWCHDWYDRNYYSKSQGIDPKGPSIGNTRVVRGGAWFFNVKVCRSANRFYISPNYRDDDRGFRLVMPLEH